MTGTDTMATGSPLTRPVAGRADEGPSAAVQLDSVTKRFATETAVHPLDLAVRDGEFVTLLGPSGCGKTTLLRMIAGLEVPDDGTVSIFGEDVTDRPANKRPVNLVFQRVTLFPHLTVAENVAFGLRLRRAGKRETGEKVRAALELVRLPDFGSRRVTELSGGQAQRVALARAIANEPKVLLLDEPLSALDLEIRRQLQAELKDIHRRLGLTFIYVTHDQEEAMSMSDRVLVMRAGRIVQAGSPVEIYRQPRSAFVARFLGMSNVLPVTVAAAEDGWLQLDAGDLRFRARQPAPPLAAGQDAAMVIRPDSFELGPAAPGHQDAGAADPAGGPADVADAASPASGAGGLAGEIRDVRFVGSVVHYRVHAAGRDWQVSTRAGHEEVLTEGTPVRLTWRDEEVIAMSEQ
jgi:ABC-type Fe3+/spermidine/putrescine transport system ATPase subunit